MEQCHFVNFFIDFLFAQLWRALFWQWCFPSWAKRFCSDSNRDWVRMCVRVDALYTPTTLRITSSVVSGWHRTSYNRMKFTNICLILIFLLAQNVCMNSPRETKFLNGWPTTFLWHQTVFQSPMIYIMVKKGYFAEVGVNRRTHLIYVKYSINIEIIWMTF